MSFWLSDPLKLVEDINVIPSDSQSYGERMNTLTRLVVLIAIVMYLLKFKGAVHFLVFGVILIIILYYSQRDQMKANFTPESRVGAQIGGSILNVAGSSPENPGAFTPQDDMVGAESVQNSSLWGDVYSGTHQKRYLQQPVLPPRSSDGEAWGGYHPGLNNRSPRPMNEYDGIPVGPRMNAKYSSEIKWSDPRVNQASQRAAFSMKGSRQGNPEQPRQRFGIPGEFPVQGPSQGMMSVSDLGKDPRGNQRASAKLPPNLDVEGRDERFVGNEEYYHGRTVSRPTSSVEHVQAFNNGGLTYNPDYRDPYNAGAYAGPAGIADLTWDPKLVPNARTAYQKMAWPDDTDDRTGSYRPRSYHGGQWTAGDPTFPTLNSVNGNDQYFTTRSGPYDGLFAFPSNVAHIDYIRPDGTVIPRYKRTPNGEEEIDDYLEHIKERQIADELAFRDSMLETAASKIAAEDYTYRMGPILSPSMM